MVFEFCITFLHYFNVLDFSLDIIYLTTYAPTSTPGGLTVTCNWLYDNSYNLAALFFYQIQLVCNTKLISFAVVNTAFKFIVLIALLIFVRGGIPRYRYDFLTKVGWIKFLSLILSIFLSSLLLILLF
jgi:NADH:ubiquinone oxidoreductase subunit H